MNKKTAKLVSYVENLSDFEYQSEIDGNYCNMGATIIDGILQAGINYKAIVAPRVTDYLKEYESVKTTSQFKSLIEKIGVSTLINWKVSDKTKRIEKLTDFLVKNGIENEEDFKQWLSSEKNCERLKQLPGIKDKTADYFKMLTGHNTNAVDRHLIRFLRMAGIETCSYSEAQTIISEAASILNVEESYFDHSIWKYMKKNQTCNIITE